MKLSLLFSLGASGLFLLAGCSASAPNLANDGGAPAGDDTGAKQASDDGGSGDDTAASCTTSSDCTTWDCVCNDATPPISASGCNDGVCDTGAAACDPLCKSYGGTKSATPHVDAGAPQPTGCGAAQGDTCGQCFATSCCTEMTACSKDTACQTDSRCLYTCTGAFADCVTKCNTTSDAAFAAYAQCMTDKGCASDTCR
jgi:hypothetical protein